MNRKRSKTILIVILSIIIVIAIVAGFVVSAKKKSDHTKNNSVTTSESVVVSEDEVAKDRLLKDKYPEINDLIKRYREALTNGDVDALKEVYNTQDDISSEILSSTAKIIEGYSNTVCYTKKGLENNSYFVFVYDDLKISGIETPVPNLTMVYVKCTPDQKYYIDRGTFNDSTGTYDYDDATKAYIQKLYEDEEVKDLMAVVYQQKEAACAKDEALRDFIDGLVSPTADVTEETVSGAETSESETEESETVETESETAETEE